jgi:hypothetical protein
MSGPASQPVAGEILGQKGEAEEVYPPPMPREFGAALFWRSQMGHDQENLRLQPEASRVVANRIIHRAIAVSAC